MPRCMVEQMKQINGYSKPVIGQSLILCPLENSLVQFHTQELDQVSQKQIVYQKNPLDFNINS